MASVYALSAAALAAINILATEPPLITGLMSSDAYVAYRPPALIPPVPLTCGSPGVSSPPVILDLAPGLMPTSPVISEYGMLVIAWSDRIANVDNVVDDPR